MSNKIPSSNDETPISLSDLYQQLKAGREGKDHDGRIIARLSGKEMLEIQNKDEGGSLVDINVVYNQVLSKIPKNEDLNNLSLVTQSFKEIVTEKEGKIGLGITTKLAKTFYSIINRIVPDTFQKPLDKITNTEKNIADLKKFISISEMYAKFAECETAEKKFDFVYEELRKCTSRSGIPPQLRVIMKECTYVDVEKLNKTNYFKIEKSLDAFENLNTLKSLGKDPIATMNWLDAKNSQKNIENKFKVIITKEEHQKLSPKTGDVHNFDDLMKKMDIKGFIFEISK